MNDVDLNVIYIAQSRIPSSEANSVHVMRMCEALSEHAISVELWIPHLSEPPAAVFPSYGVVEAFSINGVDKRGKGSLSFLAALLPALWRAKKRRPVVITRSLLGALAAVLTGHDTTFEIHQPVDDYGPLHARLFRWLTRRDRLVAIVVITYGLKRW